MGALVGAAIGTALPGFSKFFLWIIAILAVALLHRHFEQSLESRLGTLATVIVALLVGPMFTLLRGTMQSLFSFFYLFVTVAAGFIIGSMFRDNSDSEEET